VVSTTDQEGNTTLVDLDERGMPRELKVPHDNPGGTYRTTRYEYDEVGNRTRVTTPRGVVTTDDPDDFAYGSVYDELNRVKEQLLPFDRDDASITTPDKVTYAYDDVGNLTAVSAPPSAGQTVRNTTTYTHFDNGWVKSTTDPWDIATTYDYSPLGQQASRTITSAGGSSSRTMSWAYFPDGKLAARTDDGVPVGRQVRQTKANGNTVDHTYFLDGLLKTQVEKKANGTLVSQHTLAYDANGHRTSDAAKKQNADDHRPGAAQQPLQGANGAEDHVSAFPGFPTG